MNYKTIKKEYREIFSSPFNLENIYPKKKSGIIYTLYSDKFNLLRVGFAENHKVLKAKLSCKEFILLDMKRGNKEKLNLIIKTLIELDCKVSDNLNFDMTTNLLRHLSTLGWPVGKSIYKQRRITKELSCA